MAFVMSVLPRRFRVWLTMDDYELATKLFSHILDAGISGMLQGEVYGSGSPPRYEIHTFGNLRTPDLRALLEIAEANPERVSLVVNASGGAVLAILPLI